MITGLKFLRDEGPATFANVLDRLSTLLTAKEFLVKRSNLLHKTPRLMISLLVSTILASATIATPLTAFAKSLENHRTNFVVDPSGTNTIDVNDPGIPRITINCDEIFSKGYQAFIAHRCQEAIEDWYQFQRCKGTNDAPPPCGQAG
jgi:hypothetical protein